MSCPCDFRQFPRALGVPAGLHAGPFLRARMLGLFPDWRQSILAAIGAQPALRDWRARAPHDLGVMLAEMGAYVFDACDFYEALAAGETFLLPAQLPAAQRRLAAVLGYRPRPAVGSSAWLAVEADGKRVVSLPAGVGFRSGDFAGNPPQVFETEAAASIDPRINRFTVERVALDAIAGPTLASLLVDPGSLRARVGQPIVIESGGQLAATRVGAIVPVALRSRTPAARVDFTAPIAVPAGATYSGLRVLAVGASRGLWKLGEIGGDTETAISAGGVLLESVAPVRAKDVVLFERGTELEARYVTSTAERQRTLLPSLTSTLKDTSNTVTGTVVSPPVTVAITQVALDTALTWAASTADHVVVHHPLVVGARVLVPLKDTLAVDDPISVPGLVDAPRVSVSRLLLEDAHLEGVASRGSFDTTAHAARVAQGEDWGRVLDAAVTLYGNVIEVTRGETVVGEVLGMGDGAQQRQTFRLRKKPLTYLRAANAAGIRSTLTVRVGNVRWHEVDSFFGATDADRVYIVRVDDDGETAITFGGGARLSTGALVTADYRHGAGAAAPPAGSISQLAKPFPGIATARNVLPAFGGADAEPANAIAVYGPRSALLLGRAVSLQDLEAAASSVPGVLAARAMWRWDAMGQRAVAQVQYIGAAGLVETLRAKLRSLAEPDAPIQVLRALSQPSLMSIDAAIDADHVPGDVRAALREALYRAADLPGTGGLLRPEHLGPEGPLFLSRIAEATMAVDGVAALQSVSLDGAPFVQWGVRPLPGRYFDFGEPGSETSRLVINGEA
jgi:predicted phage baseplate assembly protein